MFVIVSGRFGFDVFFLDRLVSAQRLSALFRISCSVAHLTCLACFPRISFDKNRCYEIVWNWVFYCFLRHFEFFLTFWKVLVFIKNYSTDLSKTGIVGKTASSPVCMLNLLLSFYFTSLSTASEKV